MARQSFLTPWLRALHRPAAAASRKRAAAVVRALQRAEPSPREPGQWIQGLAATAAGSRSFLLYRPPALVAAHSAGNAPVLVMLHGCGQDAMRFARGTRMNRLADRHGFLVVYPQQDRTANVHGCWNWFDTRRGRAADEAALILDAVEQVCARHGGDRLRVAVAGLSAGGSMAALLATLHPERFKAVVVHSGVAPGAAHSSASALQAMRGLRSPGASAPAEPGAWPPLLVIQGGQDPVVDPANGAAAVALWAGRFSARTLAPRHVQRGQRHPMSITEHRVGRRTVATLVEVPALRHAWSGGTAGHPHCDPRGPDASRMTWSFVARQFGARH